MSVSLDDMKTYLSRSISSLNTNKLNGLLAEVDFRNYLKEIGFQDRVSVGGWIARSEGEGNFGHNTVVLFPEIIKPDSDYTDTDLQPSAGLYSVATTFHQIGIKSYYCFPIIEQPNNSYLTNINWYGIRMGLPSRQDPKPLLENIEGFNERSRRYNFLRYDTDVSDIPLSAIPEEFSKEHLRISFQNKYLCEISDVDGIFWGGQYVYPIEIKEKTAAEDKRMGEYFGLDLGPFVKLAFYASRRGNLHSLFVVREINDIQERQLIGWWFITFDKLAKFASWTPQGGGRNMQGGMSTVVKIPKHEFKELNAENLSRL